MQSHRIISGLTIFVMVALVAVGYFLVAQPQLAAASTASAQLVDAQSQISTTQAALISLKEEQKKLPALKAQLKALQLSIPSDIDGSSYIRGLNELASTAGVTITSIVVTDPQAYIAPVSAAPVVTPSASPSPSATPSPAATTPAVTGWTPTTNALITGTNFVDIPVTVTVTGSFDTSLGFINGLQTGTRLFLVTGITTKQADVGAGVTTTVTGYIYALIDPKTAAAQATAEKAAAAATATPTPTATPTVTTSPSGTATPTPTQSPTPTKKP